MFNNVQATRLVTARGTRKIQRPTESCMIALNGHIRTMHSGKVDQACPACQELSKALEGSYGKKEA